MSRRAVLLVVALAGLAWAGPAAAQCPMCRAVVEGAVEGQRVAMGLNHGILLMVAAPYLIIGSFLGVVFRPRLQAALARWKADRARPVATGN